MRASGLLLNVLEQSEAIGHKSRARALFKAVDAVTHGSKLTVTKLGRGWASNADEKHRIKAADALLSNRHLHRERRGIYRALVHRMLLGVSRLVVLVDWSATVSKELPVLRATVAVKGRSLVVWEEVYEESEYNCPKRHAQFLRQVHATLPAHDEVVVITDAGFRAPWFRQVESYGWHWLGRIRSRALCQRAGDDLWQAVGNLRALAGRKPKGLGEVKLNKTGTLRTHMFVSKEPTPKRRGPRRHAEHYRSSRSHREPWLLAASPGLGLSAKQAVALYATRMQIEQSFRDLKNAQHSFGLCYSRSFKRERVAILLLIAALASVVLWLTGLVAIAQGWMRRFQANTVRDKLTLSIPYLGARVLKRPPGKITDAMLKQTLADLRDMLQTVPVNA